MLDKKPNIAVIYFPGNNCEEETLTAVLASGMDGKILRWNQRKALEKFDAYIIPGGWGYEEFKGDSQTERSLTTQGRTACYKCHTQQRNRDFVFSAFRK